MFTFRGADTKFVYSLVHLPLVYRTPRQSSTPLNLIILIRIKQKLTHEIFVERARRDLDFEPRVGPDEGVGRDGVAGASLFIVQVD